MDFLGMGPWEILLILVIAVILLGPGKIVDFARTLGKWARAVRRAGNEFTAAVTREVDKIEKIEKEPPPREAETAPAQPAAGHQAPVNRTEGKGNPEK